MEPVLGYGIIEYKMIENWKKVHQFYGDRTTTYRQYQGKLQIVQVCRIHLHRTRSPSTLCSLLCVLEHGVYTAHA